MPIMHKRSLSFTIYITIIALRTFLTTFSPRQIQLLFPCTGQTCKNWHTKQRRRKSHISSNLELHSHPLFQFGGCLHWLSVSNSETSKVLLFFHGGGYAVPISNGHLDWCLQHIKEADAVSIELSVAVLEYSLAPGAQYPTQLIQAAKALQMILDCGVRPSEIIIGGDSAGGNLTFALLSHLLHPHPRVKRIMIKEALAGAFGISPWVTMNMQTSSVRQNKTTDMLSPSLVRQSAQDFLMGTTSAEELEKGEGWSLPGDARAGWWGGLGKVVRNVYLSVGNCEMFHDQVVLFAQVLRRENEIVEDFRVKLDIGEKESHDHVLTHFLRHEPKARVVNVLMDWTKAALSHDAKGL